MSERRCGDVDRTPTDQRFKPRSLCHVLAEAGADHGSRPVDQEQAQTAIAASADPSDVFLASARLDARRQAEPSCEVTRRLELPSVADCSDDRAGRHWPYSRRRGASLALGTALMPSQDSSVDCRDLFVEGIDMG